MKNLVLTLVCLFSVLLSNGQIYTDGINGPLLMYDNAEVDPVAKWGTAKTKGWNYFSGGDHNPANTSQSASVKRLEQGQEGAPAPRAGKSSYRFRVIKDNTYPECCNYVRSEMYWGGGNGNEFTDVQWQAVSMFIPTDWCDDNRPVGIAFDNKFANAQGPASFYLKIENGQYQVNRQYPQGGQEYRTNVGAIQKGVWVDFVLHRNYKGDNTGFMELFINKKMVWSHYGPNYMMDAGTQTEGYVLQGIYKWSWSSPNGQGEGVGICNSKIEVFMDEFKFGNSKATLESMSPGGTPPAPQPTPNDPPIVFAGNDIVTNGFPTTLLATAKDPEGGLMTYQWEVFRGSVTLSSNRVLTPSVTSANVGSNGLRLTVTDNKGAKSTDTVSLTYTPVTPANRPPVVSAGPNQTVTVNAASLSGTATDPDSDAMTYKWEVVSGTGTFSSVSILKPTVSNLTAGANTYRLTATDSKGLSANSTVVITYSPPVPSEKYPVRSEQEIIFKTNIPRLRITVYYNDGTKTVIE